MLNKYVANLILQKYAHRADTEYLRLSSLNFESNKAILTAEKVCNLFIGSKKEKKVKKDKNVKKK